MQIVRQKLWKALINQRNVIYRKGYGMKNIKMSVIIPVILFIAGIILIGKGIKTVLGPQINLPFIPAWASMIFGCILIFIGADWIVAISDSFRIPKQYRKLMEKAKCYAGGNYADSLINEITEWNKKVEEGRRMEEKDPLFGSLYPTVFDKVDVIKI